MVVEKKMTTKENKTQGMVAQVYNLRNQEAEAGGSLQVQSHCGLHREFKNKTKQTNYKAARATQ